MSTVYHVIQCGYSSFHSIHHKVYPVLHHLYLTLHCVLLAFGSRGDASSFLVYLLGVLLSASSFSWWSFLVW